MYSLSLLLIVLLPEANRVLALPGLSLPPQSSKYIELGVNNYVPDNSDPANKQLQPGLLQDGDLEGPVRRRTPQYAARQEVHVEATKAPASTLSSPGDFDDPVFLRARATPAANHATTAPIATAQPIRRCELVACVEDEVKEPTKTWSINDDLARRNDNQKRHERDTATPIQPRDLDHISLSPAQVSMIMDGTDGEPVGKPLVPGFNIPSELDYKRRALGNAHPLAPIPTTLATVGMKRRQDDLLAILSSMSITVSPTGNLPPVVPGPADPTATGSGTGNGDPVYKEPGDQFEDPDDWIPRHRPRGPRPAALEDTNVDCRDPKNEDEKACHEIHKGPGSKQLATVLFSHGDYEGR